jgi:tripartite-type tricarboxylate transporter receptor subunit TctC
MKKILLAALLLAATSAFAQYPQRPVQLIVPWGAGGGTDATARIIATLLEKELKQPFNVVNRTGGSGVVGHDAIAKATPDGYTIVLASNGTHAIVPYLYKQLPYDPIKDFAPITLLAVAPNILVVHPSVPARNFQEFIAYAKANPTKVNFASAAVASPGHLSGELLNLAAGIHMQHVPYKGAGQAVVDLVGGQVQVMVSGMSAVMPHIKAGRLRPLAVTGARRSPAVPEVPTIAESGFPKFEATAWYGVLAPAGTAPAIVTRLNTEILRALKLPDVKERLEYVGFEIVGSTPAAFGSYIKSEITKWAPVVKAAGVKPE